MTAELVVFGTDPVEDKIALLIEKHDGNVSKIAADLDMKPAHVRKLIDQSAKLRAAIDESFEGLIDEAVDVLVTGLRDPASFQNRFYAAKALLNSAPARRRGYGQPAATAALEIKNQAGTRSITLKWLEPPEEG